MEDRRLKQTAGIAIVFMALGAIAWLASFAMGKPAWGILVANFIYFAGITQGTLAAAVILRITSARWSAHFYRLAAATALSFFPVGLALLGVILIAKNNILYWYGESHGNLWQNSFFFLIRHLALFLVFYLIAKKLFRISTTSGAAAETGKETTSNINHSEHSAFPFNNELLVTGFFLLITFVIYETIMSWDFGMLLNKHFTDTMYSVLFILGSVYGGIACLFLLMVLAKKWLGSHAFGPDQFESLSQLILALSLFWFYVWYMQFFSIYFVNLPEETEPFYLRIFSGYFSIFLSSILLTAVIPFFTLIFKKARDSMMAGTAISISILLGLWLDRYLIAIPALVKNHKIADTAFFAPVNILFTLGVLGGVVFGLTRILGNNPKVVPAKRAEVALDPLITEPVGWL